MPPLNLVKLVNKSSEPFVGKFEGQKYVIRPHSETIVQFEAMCLWMGNPSTRDIDAKQRDRTREYARLRVKYGVYEHDTLMADQFPKLEAYDMEGKRIITVLDDPEGRAISPAAPSIAENDLLKLQLEEMQKQMTGLQSLINKQVVSDGVEVERQQEMEDRGLAGPYADLSDDEVEDGPQVGTAPDEAGIGVDDEGDDAQWSEDTPQRIPVSG